MSEKPILSPATISTFRVSSDPRWQVVTGGEDGIGTRRAIERLSCANQSIQRPRPEVARRKLEGSASVLAPGALLRLTEVCKLLGTSRSTVYKWMSDDTFPRPFKISQRAVRWRAEDIA